MGDTDQPSGKSPRNLIALAALALSASLPLTSPSQARDQNRGPQQGAGNRTAPRVQQPRVVQPGCADTGICGPKVRKRGAGIPGRPYNR